MKKTITLTLLLMFILISGCKGDGEVAIENTQESIQGSTQESTQTPQIEIPTEIVIEDDPLTVADNPPGCTMKSLDPAPGPALVTLFTPTDSDWITGKETASMTIVEYGDFQ